MSFGTTCSTASWGRRPGRAPWDHPQGRAYLLIKGIDMVKKRKFVSGAPKLGRRRVATRYACWPRVPFPLALRRRKTFLGLASLARQGAVGGNRFPGQLCFAAVAWSVPDAGGVVSERSLCP